MVDILLRNFLENIKKKFAYLCCAHVIGMWSGGDNERFFWSLYKAVLKIVLSRAPCIDVLDVQ